MDNRTLPKKITSTKVPPIKIQGIKTKLVPFILGNIKWNGNGTWIEPFMGSGVVGFNLLPRKAIFSDSNPHIINFYQEVQRGKITPEIANDYLQKEGKFLSETPSDKSSHYYTIRNRFNQLHNPLDFLFLQRSNFNGMIRFGKNGYNVPFGRKPDRFRQSLITKICNQIKWVADAMKQSDWEFVEQDWETALLFREPDDFIYLDPPYIGRFAEYYNSWNDSDANSLARMVQSLDCGFALSMWLKNEHRNNEHISQWDGEIKTNNHYYHLGANISNRKPIVEALIIKHGFSL